MIFYDRNDFSVEIKKAKKDADSSIGFFHLPMSKSYINQVDSINLKSVNFMKYLKKEVIKNAIYPSRESTSIAMTYCISVTCATFETIRSISASEFAYTTIPVLPLGSA